MKINNDVVKIIDEQYFHQLQGGTGYLIAALPNPLLDIYWLTGRPSFEAHDHARQISDIRPVFAAAIEKALDAISDTEAKMALLATSEFDCDNDEAERIAARITSARWPASETSVYLRAKVHPKIRSALFRQLLRQGEEARVIEILRWLNNDKGAVGALSLEDAFVHVRGFDVGIRFAEEVGSRMKLNQIKVVLNALNNLAGNDTEKSRLNRLRTRFGFDPL